MGTTNRNRNFNLRPGQGERYSYDLLCTYLLVAGFGRLPQQKCEHVGLDKVALGYLSAAAPEGSFSTGWFRPTAPN